MSNGVKINFKMLYYLLSILFVLIPFGQSVPMFSLAGREVNVGMSTVVIFVIFIFTNKKVGSIQSYDGKKINKIILGLSIWCLFTIFMSISLVPPAVTANSLVTWARWFQFVPIMMLIVFGKFDEKIFKNIVKLALLCGVIIGLWAIYETLNPSEFAEKYFRGAVTFTKPIFRENLFSEVISEETGYYIGSANYNIAGAYSAMAMLISLPFLFRARGRNFLDLMYFVVLLAGVLASQSRSSLVALMVGCFVIYYKLSILRTVSTAIVIFLLYSVLSIGLSNTSFGLMLAETVTELPAAIPLVFENQIYDESMGFSINVFGGAKRVITIAEAFKVFLKSPIFGCGFFGFSYQNPQLGTAENFFMQLLAETGSIGLMLFIWFLVNLWRQTAKDFKRGSFSDLYQKGFRGVFVAAIVVNMSGTLFYDQRIWGLFLMLSAIQIKNGSFVEYNM